MNNNELFINLGIDIAFKKYLAKEVDFLNYVIETLIFIYGEENIMTLYENMDSASFEYLLGKYNLPNYNIKKFYSDMDNYYKVSFRSKALKSDLHNPYFTYIEEDLIDMFIYKYKEVKFDDKYFVKFTNYLCTSKNANEYKRKMNELYTQDKTYIEKYYENKVFSVTNKIDFSIKRDNMLPIKVYEAFNLSEDKIKKLSYRELESINNQIFNYFKLSPISLNVEEKLLECVKKLENKKINKLDDKTNVKKYIRFAIILLIVVFITMFIINIIIGA